MTTADEGSIDIDDLVRLILTSRVYEACAETPLQLAPKLTARLGNQVHLKREDLHDVFSFKIRGAYNRIAQLTDDERRAGVIASSAGNHAQGVALAASMLGVRAVIVMPETTPSIKVDAVRDRGGEVVLTGASFSEAEDEARRMADEEGYTVVHPFDDPLVIAGQGTVGEEIVRHRRGSLHAVFVPVGGGGLVAGVGAYLKSVLPEVRIVGVQASDSDAMARSLAAGRVVSLDQVGVFADGVAVRRIGGRSFDLARRVIDEMVVVGNDEICAAIKDVFDDTRIVPEPAGALAVAGCKRWVADNGVRGQHLVAIVSGANMNFDRLRFVAERAELGEAREALLAVTIPERPGSFLELCRVLGDRVITEFNYRLASRTEAHVIVGAAITSHDDARHLIDRLVERGFATTDLSDNEMAKLHVRHMVGGRTHEAASEVVYRFQFPERPGALLEFLERLGGRWNISLFHYRNHGADYGRVLAGFEVPDPQRGDFEDFLRSLALPAQAESHNPAYTAFLV